MKTREPADVLGATRATTKRSSPHDTIAIREPRTNSSFAMWIERVWSDDGRCAKGINTFFGYIHGSCNHEAWEFGPTNHVENVWSALKGFIRRTYHHYHNRWLPLPLREFEARWNTPELFLSPLYYLQICLVAVPSR